MRCISTTMAAVVSTLAFVQVAFAAPPSPPPAFSWTGFYAGLNVGSTWSKNDISNTATAGSCDPTTGPGCTAVPNYSALSVIATTFNRPVRVNSFFGGGQVGYNWQFTNWVTGLEAD